MKLKLVSAISAFTIVGMGCITTIPLILNNTSNIISQSNETDKIIETNNIKHTDNVQIVNSVDQIIVENVNSTSNMSSVFNSSAAIVNNNGKQEIYVWGSNVYGKLGLGDTNDRLVPTLLDSSFLGNYLSIKQVLLSTSNYSVFTVDTIQGEQIYLCGDNRYGIFANGNTLNSSTPILFNTKQFGDFIEIKELSFGSGIKYGDQSSAFIVLSTAQGTDKIYVWGQNNAGQLGLGNSSHVLDGPKLFDTTQFGTFKSIKQFSISETSYAFIDVDGNTEKLFLWGANSFGQCATGDTITILSPRLVSSTIFNNAKIKFLKSIYSSTYVVLTRNGVDELYVWGRNDSGQLGNGTKINQLSPYRISQSSLGGAPKILDINTFGTTFIQVEINAKTQIYVCGSNIHGQAGVGGNSSIPTPVALDNSKLGNFTEVYDWSFDSSKHAIQNSMFAYLKTPVGDQLYMWGSNMNGQLGNGIIGGSTFVPTLVNTLDLSNAKIKSISQNIWLSTLLTLEINGQSESYATGQNNTGQLGTGNTTNIATFTQILPTQYTKLLPKVIPDPNLTASEALNLINPNNVLNQTELSKYVDLTTNPVPAGSILSINPTTTSADYKNGILNLGVSTNQYSDIMIKDPIVGNKIFNMTFTGFRQVTDINIVPVTVIPRNTEGTNITKIYESIVDSTSKVVNRTLLEYYFDLSSIPPSATMYLYLTSSTSDVEASFKFVSNQVYINGLPINQEYIKTNLVLSLANQIDLVLVISLSVAGGLLLIMAISIFALFRKNSKKIIF